VYLSNKLKKYSRYFFSFAWLIKQKNIFIFSHKRGRTTLLSHILGSNEQICGYRELHLKYTNKIDILRSRATLFEDPIDFAKADYLLDKILHNEWYFDEKIFDIRNNYYIFVLRTPEATMLSMIKRHLQNNTIETVGIQTKYYISRLRELRYYWNKLEGQKIAIDSDELLYDCEISLEKISQLLGIASKLLPEYKIFSNTGVAGTGDMSENIALGELNKEKKIMNGEDKKLLEEIDLVDINREYSETYNTLFAVK